MKIKFRFKQKMLTLCCIPMVLLTVISLVLGLEQFKDGMYKETKRSLYSSAIAALNLYQSQGYGDYALKSDGDVWRGMNFDVSSETSVVDGLKEKTGVDITFFYQDTAVMTSVKNDKDQRWIGMKAGDNIKNYTLQKGAELWYKNIEIDGKMCHAYIIPITQSSDGSIIGAMMASQSADGLNSMVQRYILISVAVSCVILVAVILFIFVYIGSLTRVLHDVRRVLLKVTMGDFSDARLIRIKRTDEFGELAQGTEKLKQAVEHLNVTSDRVIAAAKETSLNIDQISTTANTQKEDTRNATEDVETTNSAINLMLDHISHISTLSNDMENSSRESQAILEELLQSSRNSQETAKDIGQQVMVTNDSVQQIKSVTEYITDIAEETNLLALNASIEAARAGEAGKGFAVVAEQIQKLAEQSNNSAAKIGENIQELVDKTEGIVKAMVIIEETLKKQEESVDKTKKIFDELNTNIRNVNQKETEMQGLATLMEDLTEVANKLSENLEMFLA